MRWSSSIRWLLRAAACLPIACGGQAQQGEEEDGSEQPHRVPGSSHEPAVGGQPISGSGGVDAIVGSGGAAAADDPGQTPSRPGGSGGQVVIPVELDLWCPMGDQWELLFGEASQALAGAPSFEDCPELPDLSYSAATCVTVFSSAHPIVRADTESCCYAVERIHCR